MIRHHKVILAALLAFWLSGCGKPSARPVATAAKYVRMGSQGSALFVWIEPRHARDADAIKSVIRAVDDDRPIRIIMLWCDKSLIPTALPMSDEQLEAQVAQFNRNDNTGLKKLVVGGKEVRWQ